MGVTSTHTSAISASQSNVFKGFAISAVLVIHFVAFLPHVFTPTASGIFYTAIDQLSRFCVPLFLFLSAYGLTKKYSEKTLVWKDYIVSRLGKLIPLYIIWSVFSILAFRYIPAWGYDNQPPSLILQLLFGQADFQLYFLSLIFQLYFMFPLLRSAIRRYPIVTFLIALVVQFLWYLLLSGKFNVVPLSLQTDRIPYVLFISWIAYFVGGIYVAEKGVPKILNMVLPVLVVASAVWAIGSSVSAIQHSVDPLIALRFTRLSVFAFAGSFCLLTPVIAQHLHRLKRPVYDAIERMGKSSYILFLAHTMALRIMYALLFPLISWQQLVVITLSWVAMIVVSKRMLT